MFHPIVDPHHVEYFQVGLVQESSGRRLVPPDSLVHSFLEEVVPVFPRAEVEQIQIAFRE